MCSTCDYNKKLREADYYVEHGEKVRPKWTGWVTTDKSLYTINGEIAMQTYAQKSSAVSNDATRR